MTLFAIPQIHLAAMSRGEYSPRAFGSKSARHSPPNAMALESGQRKRAAVKIQ
jgi:hypothetical protein